MMCLDMRERIPILRGMDDEMETRPNRRNALEFCLELSQKNEALRHENIRLRECLEKCRALLRHHGQNRLPLAASRQLQGYLDAGCEAT